MKKIYVKDIVKMCNGDKIIGNDELPCNSFSKDTRTINKEDIYVGIKGESFDGNNFYIDALEKGASACILNKMDIPDEVINKFKDRTIILVEDTIKAIGEIASYKRSLYNIPVVAVTGSVGKTSTKDIISSVVSEKYKVLKTEGNLNNHIGLPFTILKLDDHEALVIEMGMNHLGEISYLSNIAKPTIAVITNVGTSHIGLLGSRENILKAKLEILDGLKENGTLIINNDNDMLNKYNNQKYNIIRYGTDEECDVIPYDIDIKENYSTYNININNEKYKIKVPVSGKHFVYNSLCAICVGLSLNMDIKDIIKGIEKFELTKNRMDIQKTKQGFTIINDSYNASYESMRASLEYLKATKGKRKIAVLGDMLELGEFAKQLHEKVGEEVIKSKVDILVTIGELSKYIANKAISLGMNKDNIYILEKNDEATILLKKILIKEDTLLLKASNSMRFTDIVENIK